jgi:hypothetical protein
MSNDSASHENVQNNTVDNGTSLGSRAILKSNQTLLERVKLNIKESEELRGRINNKLKSRLFLSFSYIQSIASNSHHDSPAQASPRLSNAGKFSIHSAISARSPIISLILPTQKVRVYIMLYAYILRS